ncbi:MAG: alanine racemase [Actinomycetota bacterium]|nr:alanine racemase [Actinomycetota bacterium]
MVRPSFAEVDLAAVAANVAAIAEEVAPASLCAVVKADGYGHGDVAVAQAAREAGAGRLAVALVEEGIRLRRAGLEGPVLVLSEPPLSAAREVLRWRLTPTVYRSEFVEALEREADVRQAVHLKVDTGMHRVGADAEQALEIARLVSDSERLELEGVWTHLAVAESDPRFTRHQLAAFHGFLRDLTDKGIEPRLAHAANTAAALLYPEARLDMVRVGLGLYGLRPAPHVAPALPLRPAMRVVSHVSLVRRLPPGARPSYGRRRSLPSAATVATVPIGYADGVPRALAERGGEVLWGGRRLPFAGTITMDHVMVDAGDLPVAVGDEVVLLGRQGDEEVTADEWAERLGTINYEVVSRIGPRLERRYHR